MTKPMHSEEDLKAVLTTIDASADQLVTEMVKASKAGSTSRIQSYSPTLVNLSWARDIIQNRLDTMTEAAMAAESAQTKKKGNQQ